MNGYASIVLLLAMTVGCKPIIKFNISILPKISHFRLKSLKLSVPVVLSLLE